MTIWFVEGLPGAGKTTMARMLCAAVADSGRHASWYLEESHDHPVHPKSQVARKSWEGYVDSCLSSWENFVKRQQGNEGVHILEGSAFQSTVRFMMEQRLPGIEDYYSRFQKIVAASCPRMIYLRPGDAIAHSRYTSALRGEDWTSKVSGYLEKTKYSVHLKRTGVEGMHRFWADYALLCDELVANAAFPVKSIHFVAGEWDRHFAQAADFLTLPDRSRGGSQL